MDAFRIGVIFDCDGTLIDSMMVWRETEAGLARRANVTLTAAEIDALTAMTIPECGAFFHERFGLGSSGDEVVAMMDELMLEFYRERALARPGALEFVQALAERGVRMSVASSSPQPYLQAGLERCGFAPYLDAIVSVDDVGASKREPAVYDHAREAMGTPLAATWGVEVLQFPWMAYLLDVYVSRHYTKCLKKNEQIKQLQGFGNVRAFLMKKVCFFAAALLGSVLFLMVYQNAERSQILTQIKIPSYQLIYS